MRSISLLSLFVLLVTNFYEPICAMQKIKELVATKKQNKLHKQLREAIEEGHCAKTLLVLGQLGIDVNAVDEQGNSPLHFAAQSWSHDICKLLVGIGANVNLQNNEGHTPLYTAALVGAHNSMVYLLEQGAKIDTPDNEGKSPLHAIITSAYTTDKRVALFLKAGADVHQMDNAGHMLLYTVLSEFPSKEEYRMGNNGNWYYQREICKMLLRRGARVDKEALGEHHIHWLLAAEIYTPFVDAIQRKGYDKVKQLITQGVDISRDISQVSRNTYDCPFPINLAIFRYDKEMVRLLLDNGADIMFSGDQELPVFEGPLVCALTDDAEMACLLLSHVPRLVLKKYKEQIAWPFLLLCKRAEEDKGAFACLPYKDIKNLLWSYCLEYCIKELIITEQLERATAACRAVSDNGLTPYELALTMCPSSAYLFDPDNLKLNYGAGWEAQVDAFFPKRLLK